MTTFSNQTSTSLYHKL